MARTALWAPAHRVAQRFFNASQQAPNLAPSVDAAGSGIQDARLPWNTANSSTGAQVVGWYGNSHSFLNVVPAAPTLTALAAAQVPVSGTPLTLVSVAGAGVAVSVAAVTALPSLNIIPSGSLFVDAVLSYLPFGISDFTVFYDASKMLARCVSIHSAGDDTGATASVVGYDVYGYPLHQTVTLANNGTVNTTKAYKVVTSITATGTLSGSNINAGLADIFGLPLYASAASAVWGFFNNLNITGAGTFVAGVTTNPATALTGDVRGTYVPGSASDAAKRLTLWQHPSVTAMSSASGVNAGMFGVAQF